MRRHLAGKPWTRAWGLGAGLLALATVLASCGGAEPTPKPTATRPPAATPTSAPAAATATTAAPTATAAPRATPTATTAAPAPTATPVPRPTATPAPTAPAVKRGGTLVVAGTYEPPHMDPHQKNWAAPPTDFIYETLVYYDAQSGEPRPRLAESWEFTTPTTFVVRLRKGARWQNKAPVSGRELTAEDVVYTMERVRTPQPSFVWKSRLADVDKVRAVDKSTVEFTFKNPYAPFLFYFGDTFNSNMAIVAKENVEVAGDLKNPANQVGTGAFLSDAWKPGVGGSVVKNPSYWQEGKPYLDRVEFNVIQDTPRLVAAWRTGKIAYSSTNWGAVQSPEKKDLARTNPEIVFTPWAQSYPQLLQMHTQKAPFTDVRVRRAIHLAVNRQQIMDLAYDGAGQLSGFVSWELFPGWVMSKDDLLKLPGYRTPKDGDIQEAKKLLADAGYTKLTIEGDISSNRGALNRENLEVATEQLKAVGIEVRLSVTDWAVWFDRENAGEFLFRGRGYGAAYEIDDQLYTRYHSKGGRNLGKFSDPQVDQLLEQQRREVDAAKRQQLTRQAERRLFELIPNVPLYTGYAYSPSMPNVKGGVKGTYSQWGRPEDIWLDK